MKEINTSRRLEALAAILSHPSFKYLIENHGLLEDSPELAIGYNEVSGNVYVGFECSLCLFAPEFRPEQVSLAYQCPYSGEEYFDLSSVTRLRDVIQKNFDDINDEYGDPDYHQDREYALDNANEVVTAFTKFEEADKGGE